MKTIIENWSNATCQKESLLAAFTDLVDDEDFASETAPSSVHERPIWAISALSPSQISLRAASTDSLVTLSIVGSTGLINLFALPAGHLLALEIR